MKSSGKHRGENESSGKRAHVNDDDDVELFNPCAGRNQFKEGEVEIGSSNRSNGVKKVKSEDNEKVSDESPHVNLFAEENAESNEQIKL